MNLIFELNNEQRKYPGLNPVEEHRELVKFDDIIYHYFEDDIIKKEITVSESISATDPDIAYLQYGLIYKEIPLSDYLKLIKELNIGPQTLRREGIGFVIDTYKLNECIEAKSNTPFWEKYNKKNVPDLKNPDHIELKRKVFKAFGLDADKSYEENLKESKFNDELENGYADMQAGRTKNINEVFAGIRKDYGL